MLAASRRAAVRQAVAPTTTPRWRSLRQPAGSASGSWSWEVGDRRWVDGPVTAAGRGRWDDLWWGRRGREGREGWEGRWRGGHQGREGGDRRGVRARQPVDGHPPDPV